jgi:hypothetical protein
MTGREAAEEQERDEARQRRRAGIQAQEDHHENEFWAAQMREETLLRYSQRASQQDTQLVPETQLSALSQLSKMPSVGLSSRKDNSSSSSSSTESSNDDDSQTGEPRRSSQVTRPTRDKASQLSQEAALARAKAEQKKGKGKQRKTRKSIPTSQLLEEFSII